LPPPVARSQTLRDTYRAAAKQLHPDLSRDERDRATRERVQAESLNRLSKELPVPPAFLPLLMEDAATPAAIRQLARRV